MKRKKKRIVDKSSCGYLEDLITCVHIIQLKSLTCMRVGQKQKKIDIDVPSLDDFIHKVYINVARKVYTNVYLFEKNIMPLQIQKHNRELELIVKESVMNTIRDNVPVDTILRAYMDETIEEEVHVEEKEEIVASDISKEKEVVRTEVVAEEKSTDKKEEKIEVKKSGLVKTNVEMSVDTPVMAKVETAVEIPTETPIMSKVETPVVEALEKTNENKGLSFNNIDATIDDSNREKLISAPKTDERLEKISELRHEQRKIEEEEDDDKLTIGDAIKLDDMSVQDVEINRKINPDPLLMDVEVLT